MPNFCKYSIRLAGPEKQATSFAAHWDGLMRDCNQEPDANGYCVRFLDFKAEYPEVPEKPVPYYGKNHMGCKIKNGIVEIDAVSYLGPPLDLIVAMSARWPDLEYVLTCTVVDGYYDIYEQWFFKDGDIASIALCVSNIHAADVDEVESWYVRDGQLFHWPEWHPVVWKEKVSTHPLPKWAVTFESHIDWLTEMERDAEKIVGFVDVEVQDASEDIEKHVRG